MFKVKERGKYVKGRIVSIDKDKIIISFDSEDFKYKKGQRVRATVSTTRKTALGKNAKISEVIAQGTISEVVGKTVTIHSKCSNPIISQKALLIAGKPKAVVNVKTIP